MPSASTTPKSSARLRWSGLAGAVVSLVLLWWALHDVSARDVWVELSGVRLGPFLLAIVVATLPFPLRTVRWRYLLRLEGETLPFVPLWHATAIGFMANNLLPARAGEVARAYSARRLTGVRFSAAFTSIAVERVMDGIVLVTMLTVAVWAGGFDGGTTIGEGTLGGIVRGAGILFAGLLAAAFVLVHWPAPAVAFTRAVTGRLLPPRWGRTIIEVLEGVLAGLDSLRSPARLLGILFWSFVVWITAAASFWICFVAFGIEVPLSAALLVQALVSFGVAVPSSPGFVGVFEIAVRISLALYGIDEARAVPYALGYHLGTFIPITLLGIWSLSRAHLHLADLRAAHTATDEPAKASEASGA